MTIAEKPSTKQAMDAVLAVYESGGEVANDELYEAVKSPLGFSDDDYERKERVGEGSRKHCLAQREVRWVQQSLRRLGLVERVPGKRGIWRLRGAQEKELTPAPLGMVLLGFSTKLGIALWASCDAFNGIHEPIALCLTSPPYALAKPRRYGNPPESGIVDFIVGALEPIVRNLIPGRCIALNLSNEVFLQGLPARSTWVERLTLAAESDLGRRVLDRVVWSNPCKPPGPMPWASKTRQVLNVGWEPVVLFTNDPLRCIADNRRVLLPHTERHRKLVASGGEQRDASYSDGAYRLRAGKSFSTETAGRIPKNVLQFTQHSSEISRARAAAQSLGLPVHGALMPLGLARFLVQYLSREEDLVVDTFSGWGTTAVAAEEGGRRWITTERHAEYVVGHAVRMRGCAGFRSAIPLDVSHAGLF